MLCSECNKYPAILFYKKIENVNHNNRLLGLISDAGCSNFQGSINQGRKRNTN